MYVAVAIPVGLFWSAFTNYESIHWISPVVAGIPFGFGFTVVFLAVTKYLVDSCTIFAASALAANTGLRSLFGATFPLFTNNMFDALEIHWATSVPAFAALACLPLPFVFYRYGARIRSRCVYATEAESVMDELRAKAVRIQDLQTDGLDENSARRSSSNDSDSEKEVETSAPRFEPLKARRSVASDADRRASLTHVASRKGSISEAANYHASPFDIDRLNTSASSAGLDLTRTRTTRFPYTRCVHSVMIDWCLVFRQCRSTL